MGDVLGGGDYKKVGGFDFAWFTGAKEEDIAGHRVEGSISRHARIGTRYKRLIMKRALLLGHWLERVRTCKLRFRPGINCKVPRDAQVADLVATCTRSGAWEPPCNPMQVANYQQNKSSCQVWFGTCKNPGVMNPILLLKCNACRLPKTAIAWPAWVAAALLLAASFGLNSCSTARGLGQDIQKGGEKIEDAARR